MLTADGTMESFFMAVGAGLRRLNGVGQTDFAGIVADAAAQLTAGALRVRDVVAWPAMERNRDGGEVREAATVSTSRSMLAGWTRGECHLRARDVPYRMGRVKILRISPRGNAKFPPLERDWWGVSMGVGRLFEREEKAAVRPIARRPRRNRF